MKYFILKLTDFLIGTELRQRHSCQPLKCFIIVLSLSLNHEHNIIN